MTRQKPIDFDNRDSGQVYEYLEARIEAMKRRIMELESENAGLRFQLVADEYAESDQFVASA